LCPPGTDLVPAEELPARGWFDVKAVPLRGKGSSPIAYQVRLGGKVVLFSGRIPMKSKPPDTDAALYSELAKSRETTLDYLMSVFRLREPKPELWLPAVPVDGQNANLYDDEWLAILAANYRVGYRSLMGRR
jgi:hypothetical protein